MKTSNGIKVDLVDKLLKEITSEVEDQGRDAIQRAEEVYRPFLEPLGDLVQQYAMEMVKGRDATHLVTHINAAVANIASIGDAITVRHIQDTIEHVLEFVVSMAISQLRLT